MKCSIVEDLAGVFQNHPRLTCISCDVTLVHQPYMTIAQWKERVAEFRKQHQEMANET